MIKYYPRKFRKIIESFLCWLLRYEQPEFETTWCDSKDFKGENFPSDMGRLLSQFELGDRYYVIYIKK